MPGVFWCQDGSYDRGFWQREVFSRRRHWIQRLLWRAGSYFENFPPLGEAVILKPHAMMYGVGHNEVDSRGQFLGDPYACREEQGEHLLS
jgi:hypothetical protein